ncbi:hypothetical protein SKAU_G00211240 [Synaphobranchus kaupii]|uniref:Endonuclease/exonuclease/phosphatase domain-containing protein n=1 Tax=Synaphobranchus kaupii TaxID=118154 RepID=A0A9Q1F958_SYNKA|nr:hypothetical protein SKAU_G00211240 [Synaphobranchus kaupii]
MKLCDESREKATELKPLLSTRDIRIGTWNVRTMNETGKTMQVAAEMRRYNLDLLGISETRWIQFSQDAGQQRLTTGELLLYSGHEEDKAQHTEGVGLFLLRTAQRALIGWEAHGPRLITASFRTKKRKIQMNVVQCYAPTNDSDDENKDDFYNKLQSILEHLKGKDISILMGDFNAKIGRDNTGYEEVMGKQGLGEISKNGEIFVDTCALNNLVIGGSVFPHKRIHKATWVSPDDELLRRDDLQSYTRRTAHSKLPSKDRRQTRLFTVPFPLPPGYRLDNEDHNGTEEKRHPVDTQLDGLDFADDLALLSHSRQPMQEKTRVLANTSSQVGLNIHKGKTKTLKVNTTSEDPVTLEGTALEEVEAFTYLGF